jgi:ribosomal protein S18 acetylase RimI-like enzyme
MSESDPVRFACNTADHVAVLEHLGRCADRFVPPLKLRVDLLDYARRITDNTVTFEAWTGNSLSGLVAAYLNDGEGRCGFITSVSVDASVAGQGLATVLLRQCLAAALEEGFESLSLEVSADNQPAIAIYRKLGFTGSVNMEMQFVMKLNFK